ncbi:uncharacterized protein LOC131648854 [Vicia villosa]|uniref:uncharacterized protein LOC131648854 n=1 Tax=Vicia villosa TaxID=3911 RepID=UPI00273C96D7|nr:uncharacterized protein LOC131648854 [Vicia villosa]
MEQQGHQRHRIINGSHVYYGDVIGPFVPWNVISNVNYQMMSVPYGSHGGNQLRRSIPQIYAHVEDGHFILNDQVNHVSTRRFIEPHTPYHTNLGRNQPRVSTQDVLPANAYVQDGHLILQQNNINQALLRRDIKATQTRSVTNLKRITIEDGTTNSEHITCSICLMELSSSSIAIQLPSPCSHVYHEDCIMRWFDRSRTCPLCRRSVL